MLINDDSQFSIFISEQLKEFGDRRTFVNDQYFANDRVEISIIFERIKVFDMNKANNIVLSKRIIIAFPVALLWKNYAKTLA